MYNTFEYHFKPNQKCQSDTDNPVHHFSFVLDTANIFGPNLT